MDLPLSVEEAAASLRSGDTTSVALTDLMLARADALDPELGTYLARFDDSARLAAKRADEDFAAGVDRGPLQGIPVAVKDILAMAEGPTTAQSLVLDPEWGAGHDAPVVTRLKAAGAVITGKVTTMEFAIGFPDKQKPFPLPRNPWDLATWPGGSSSGTGSGVAAGLFLAGIGTDTGGSIRIPAAFCGVSGLMPTFGRVPKSGVVPLGYTLDHVGPLARSAWDCAAMLDAIAGFDASDPYCVDVPVPAYVDALAEVDGLAGLRIGVMREHHVEAAAPAVTEVFDAAVDALATLGADVVDVTIPYYREVTAAGLMTMASEAFAYHRSDLRDRWHDYGDKTRDILAWGAFVTGPDYVQAQRVRRVGQRALGEVLAAVDVIVTPTATAGAPSYELIDEIGTLGMFGSVHTSYWDAVGNPALVVPIGFDAGGLPLSLQLAGKPFDEVAILRAGHAYQQTTDWHRRVPPFAAAG